MPEAVVSSPLAGFLAGGQRQLQVDGRAVTLEETPFSAMLNLRGDPDAPAFVQAVLQATGLHLPLKANTASINPQRQLLWLGPDEWLLKCREGQARALADAVRTVLQGQHVSVVEVGDGNTTLLIYGPAAAELLARGCPLDLHPRVFVAGNVAQSHAAKASATILCLEPGTRFEVTVRRSFADYLARWLCAAGE